MGRKGAGYDTLPFLIIDGTMTVASARGFGRLDSIHAIAPMLPSFAAMRLKGLTSEMAMFQLARKAGLKGFVSVVLFRYCRVVCGRSAGRAGSGTLTSKKDVDEYLAEAVRLGWQVPPPGDPAQDTLLIRRQSAAAGAGWAPPAGGAERRPTQSFGS